MKIITNGKPRELISWDDLSPKEREDFDYVEKYEGDDYKSHPRFFRYKGNVYDVDDCESVGYDHNSELASWNGHFSETFFSGVVFKFAPDTDYEEVIVGRYYT